MPACAVCGVDLPVQRGPRARRYCSRSCQAKAYRARQEQQQGHRSAAADEQRLVGEYADVPSRQLADSLSLAAGRVASALAAGQPADDFDLGVLARIPVVLAVRAHRAAAEVGGAPAAVHPAAKAPTVAVIDLATPPDRSALAAVQPSRDDAAPAPTPAPPTGPPVARRRQPARASRDDLAAATEPSPAKAAGVEPRPQKLPMKRAKAMVDAAELVRDSNHRDNHRWILRSGDTVLGYVEPSYGGVSRSGRNGWTYRLGGMLSDYRSTTRDGAAVRLADSWMRVVIAEPRRTITGGR